LPLRRPKPPSPRARQPSPSELTRRFAPIIRVTPAAGLLSLALIDFGSSIALAFKHLQGRWVPPK
jgi:hypothetical protein